MKKSSIFIYVYNNQLPPAKIDRMYKALITDLDGTAVRLTSDGSDVTKHAKDAVACAERKGYKVACATGRQWTLARPVVEALDIKSPCIIEGGTRIVAPKTGESLWEKHLDHGAVEKILDLFRSHKAKGRLLTSAQPMSQPLDEVVELPQELRFAYLLAIERSKAIEISNDINVQGFAVAHVTPAWSGDGRLDVHVTHPLGTKEHAMKEWHKIEGVSVAETIGMGDSGNDVPLFQSAGLKVAVSNATDELKELADYIAPNTGSEALRHVIDKFLLIQAK